MSRGPDPSPCVRIVKLVPASPRVVFEAWLDPEALRRFMCPAAGSQVARAEVDARVGGAFLIVMRFGDQDRPHRGEYLELERYRRLAFTWRSAHAGDGSHVVLQLEPVAGGAQTRLTLEQFGLPDDQITGHEAGWTRILDALDAAVAA